MSTLALFLALGFEGEVFLLETFFFFPLVETGLATSEVGSTKTGTDCVGYTQSKSLNVVSNKGTRMVEWPTSVHAIYELARKIPSSEGNKSE